ncbi:MAG: hypothetical protein LRY55_03280 [Leadbetterella sp.]|nr:hypothetical protein [Leadbetterella sp.]
MLAVAGSVVIDLILAIPAAYALSRYDFKGREDIGFYILSTRMMPPIAVAIPIFLMYRTLGLSDTHLGMIILYTAVNLSLSVWLLKVYPLLTSTCLREL